MSDAVVWAETPDDDGVPERSEEAEEGAEVDETLATRRLRHWLRGMFGGRERPPNDDSD